MKRAEIICALALLTFAGIGTVEPVRLVLGGAPAGPRAGFFPFWLSLILGACSAVILAKAIRMDPAGETAGKPFVSKKSLRPVLAVFLPMAGAVVLIEVIGLFLPSALY